MPAKSPRKSASKKTALKKSDSSSGRILTTHVGSLVRPAELKMFLAAQRDRKPYDEAAFGACLHDSVADVVRQQANIGLDIINDGEYGKTISWSRYDCGFAQGPFVQRVHPSIMWAKLRALVEGARIASKRLWTRRAAA
jgi:methionine synthase II (cobalamin-independent)